MKKSIAQYCASRCLEFGRIQEDRKVILDELSSYLKYKKGDEVNLLIVENNQKLVGHLLRIWMQVSASYFEFPFFSSLSIGIKKHEIETNWLHTMLNIGFDIECKDDKGTQIYSFYLSEEERVSCQALQFEEPTVWPKLMACFIEEGVVLPDFNNSIEFSQHFSFPDSSWADGSSQQEAELHKLVGQVAREMLYVFSSLSDTKK
ncbi:MAG: hypothetical protein KJ941_10955 [Bacteroidetes bacterium]|nr:hypothetical protein [Bacteroidota bacterium]